MRINELLGKSIVTADTGEKVGRVEDVLLDASQHAVIGVLVSDGVLTPQRVVPFNEVQTVGPDIVIVRTATTIAKATEWVHDGRSARRAKTLTDKEVVTSDGARIGRVQDLHADDGSGQVVALEVTAPQRSRRSRRALVPVDRHVTFTNDVVVITETMSAHPHLSGTAADRRRDE